MPSTTENTGTLELLLTGIAQVIEPLKDQLKEGKVRVLLAQLGLELPAAAEGVPSFNNAAKSTATAAGKLPDQVKAVMDGIKVNDYTKVGDLLQGVLTTIKAIKTLADSIKGLGGTTGIPSSVLNEFAEKLPRRLIDYLIVSSLEGAPILPEVLEFFGIISRSLKNSGSTDPNAPEYTEYGMHFDQIGDLIKSPVDLLGSRYDWGESGFDGSKLLPAMQSLLGKAGFPAITDNSGLSPVLDVLAFELSANKDVSPKGLNIKFSEDVSVDTAQPFTDGGDWQIEGLAKGDIEANAEMIIQPNGNFTFKPPSGGITGKYGIRFTAGKADHTPFIIFGKPEASRLEVAKFVLIATAGLNYDSDSTKASAAFKVGGEIKDGKLKIDVSEGDGFLAKILSGIKIDSDFDMEFGFDSKEGLYFTGSTTLDIQLPSHIDLGPVEIEALTFSVGIDTDDQELKVPIGLSANIMAALGPIATSVEGIGIIGLMSFPKDKTKSNLGPVQFDLKFKPPKGVGLSIDAGPVKGGGFLRLDFEREEYSGTLELVLSEWIAIRAIGLITTRMPDGSKGFSMLIVLTVDFGTGIQLGYGFTLQAVGGILGVDRIVNINPLKDGIRSGSVESLMFPQDVIANAPRIISDLKSYFPVQQDTFLVGPMVKIGWGTPNLLSVSMGVILEFPAVNITIVGVLKVVLPDEKADILRLQVNFMGRLEPSNKLLWFYAELFDSRVLNITLEGGMGLFVHWGSPANFVVSVGGFHPRYSPPPLPFPSPPRIAVSILNQVVAKVQIKAYFAVTSNTVQFGARAELYFGLSAFKIEGHIAFDAMFQFDPFYFSFSISSSLSVKVFGIGLFSVGFSGLLEGPTPWHIEGKGSISLLFFSIDVPFEKTWGKKANTKLDPIQVFPLLEKEMHALTNWEAKLPASSNISVTLRQLGSSTADTLVLHPVGKLQISQRKVPLNYKIDKLGNQKPSDTNKLFITARISEETELGTKKVLEQFAIGQFKNIPEALSLSSAAYQPLEGGLELSVKGDQLRTDMAVKRVIRYETEIIDNNFRKFTRNSYHYFRTGFSLLYGMLFGHFLKGSAVAQSPKSMQSKKMMQPFDEKIKISPNEYSVAYNENNTSIDPNLTFSSQAMAMQHMEDQILQNPSLASEIHVIPNTETNFAA